MRINHRQALSLPWYGVRRRSRSQHRRDECQVAASAYRARRRANGAVRLITPPPPGRDTSDNTGRDGPESNALTTVTLVVLGRHPVVPHALRWTLGRDSDLCIAIGCLEAGP